MSKLPKATLSLKQFLLRQEVLKLYRTIFRTLRQVPDVTTRNELKEWARTDFRNNRDISDEDTIKTMLHYGKKSLFMPVIYHKWKDNLVMAGPIVVEVHGKAFFSSGCPLAVYEDDTTKAFIECAKPDLPFKFFSPL